MNTKTVSKSLLAAAFSLGLVSPVLADEAASTKPAPVEKAPAAKHKHKHKTKKEAKMTYQCPMHPEVTSDKPGKCPKCHMDLEKVEKK